jgi:hypothetical protein
VTNTGCLLTTSYNETGPIYLRMAGPNRVNTAKTIFRIPGGEKFYEEGLSGIDLS